MTDQLRPCPFCGGEAHLIYWDDDSDKDCSVDCETYTCGAFDYWSDEADVIQKWNARPLEDALKAEIERLRKALEAADRVCESIDGYIQNGEFFDPVTTKAIMAWRKAKDVRDDYILHRMSIL